MLPDEDDYTAPARLEARRREERRAVEEAGGGEAEGFEQSEQELIDHASHGDDHGTTRMLRDARDEADDAHEVHGEADGEDEDRTPT